MTRQSSQSLACPLQRARALYADSAAVIDGERVLTYRDLADEVASLGALLGDLLGISPGARVGVLAANGTMHLECLMAIPAFGRTIVSLNSRLAVEELVMLAEDADLSALFCDDRNLEAAIEIGRRCTGVRLIHEGSAPLPGGAVPFFELTTGNASLDDAPVLEADSLASISYTGGTTGKSKGVMLTHANLLANAYHNLIATGHRHEDRWLHACPMFHVAGTANVLSATWVGATQVVLPQFDAPAVCRTIEERRITHTLLVPTMIGMLLDEDQANPADLSSLQHLQYAASPISPTLQRRLLTRLECDVAQFYGMTEAAPTVTQCTPEDHRRGIRGEEPFARRLSSIGTPVVGVQVRICDPDSGEPVEPGTVGELRVRGPNVMPGYWRRPEVSAEVLVDGWYRTGDAGYADSDGYIFVVDRLKDMIITGGENVYSAEVEAVILEHPGVLEVAVVGVPDAHWGESVHAIARLSEGVSVDVDELVAHCRPRIAGFKVPRAFTLTAEPLPRTASGKVLKAQLREQFWTGTARAVN